jgi:DNA ligase-1
VPEGAEEVRDVGQPYPFFLAHQLDLPPELFKPRLGATGEWMVEWKYDGIRGQVIKREGQVWIWTRGEELATERFPEIVAAAQALRDGTVIDGEILVWQEAEGRPAPFSVLQQRIGRKNLSKKILEEAPVSFMAYDILEQDGADIRSLSQRERRERLEAVLAGTTIRVSPIETAPTWLDFARRRERSRELGVEGFMLKRMDAAYGTGRTKNEGLWWKWKIDPMTIDCVLVYAQPGSGRRSSVHTDYTFAVWSRPPEGKEEVDAVIGKIARKEPPVPGELQLVPFAKAYSGLTDEEFRQVDALIRKNTVEKFGPVRSVKPMLVFELGFEGINRSSRHRSGIAVRFPRMLRIRADKPLHEANTLADLEALLNLQIVGKLESDPN